MTSMEKVLTLIGIGDNLSVLENEELRKCLNELFSLEYLDVVDTKVVLTSKGEEALKNISEELV